MDQANKGGVTPLFMAAQNDHAAVVDALLGKGAAVDQANKGGVTPLFMAAQNDHADVVDALLGNGAAVELRSILLRTLPIMRFKCERPWRVAALAYQGMGGLCMVEHAVQAFRTRRSGPQKPATLPVKKPHD